MIAKSRESDPNACMYVPMIACEALVTDVAGEKHWHRLPCWQHEVVDVGVVVPPSCFGEALLEGMKFPEGSTFSVVTKSGDMWVLDASKWHRYFHREHFTRVPCIRVSSSPNGSDDDQ